MMGVMDLGLMDRESGRARLMDGWVSEAAAVPVGTEPFASHTTPASGSGYAPQQRRGGVLAMILTLHVLAIAVLATARYHSREPDPQQRVTSFAIQETPPVPPLKPLPAEAAVDPISAPVVAPAPVIDTPSAVEVQAVRPETVRLTIAPVAQVVNNVAPPAPARPAPAAPAPIVPPDFSAAQLKNPKPAFPFLSKRAREEGVVLLKVLVSTDGRAARLQVEESSGFERLDEAAVATVRKWRFVPATQAGQPREAWVLVPVTFSLG